MADLSRNDGGLRELALFAGAGGGILAGELLGDRTVCAVEIDRYAASILVRRQNDGSLPPFPIWDDVRTFDGKPWRGIADCVSGGFPCQDISVAGGGAGLEGERSGLWREFARVVREVRPRVVRVENSPMLTARGLGVVLGDLAALGFDARWDVLSAADCGAYHLRERIWIVAHAAGEQHQDGASAERREGAKKLFADSLRSGFPLSRQEPHGAHGREAGRSFAAGGGWPSESGLVRMVHGVPHRVDRIRCLGNAQIPRVAATAWRILTEAL
jgi:DNA (cytosine-5)-methyltransferase 1